MSPIAGFLTAAMEAREQSHRRFVLCGIGMLLILSVTPVLGHHVATQVDTALMAQDHIGILCLIALHALLAPVHGLFHLLLMAGLVYALLDRLRASWRLRQTLRLLLAHSGSASPVILTAIAGSGVPAHLVRVVRGLPNPAFTAGWWSPMIYVADEIMDTLTRSQLAAVLAHEAEHVRRRDPLRLSLLRFLARTLFWIPAFRRLAADMADEAEIAADDAAAGERPLVLASALVALAAWRGSACSGAGSDHLLHGAAVSLIDHGERGRARHDALLDRRVRRLAGETAVVASHVTGRSLLGAAVLLSVVWMSGIVVAHPMPTAAPEAAHCTHANEHSFAHLFCRLDHRVGAVNAPGCPHAHTASA